MSEVAEATISDLMERQSQIADKQDEVREKILTEEPVEWGE